MDLESIRQYCLKKPGTTEELPFGPDTLVFKVLNKMYLLIGLDNTELRFNVKCDPEKAIELREQYTSVIPGYHMNKKHWNTIIIANDLDDEFIFQQIDNSYILVLSSLPKKSRNELERIKN